MSKLQIIGKLAIKWPFFNRMAKSFRPHHKNTIFSTLQNMDFHGGIMFDSWKNNKYFFGGYLSTRIIFLTRERE